MDSRTAISGLMPARPLRMPESVLRLTPSDRAVSVTFSPNGSRHKLLSTSPGCGGLCIFIVASVVVLIVDTLNIFPSANERDSPVAAHFHRPRAFSLAAQLVKVQAGQVHVACGCRYIQPAEDQSKPVSVLRLNARPGSGGKEPFESFMSKSFDGHALSVTQVVTGRTSHLTALRKRALRPASCGEALPADGLD